MNDILQSKDDVAQLIRQSGILGKTYLLHRVHSQITCKNGMLSSTYLANLLIQAFGRCADTNNARMIFNHITSPNIFSWNIMIATYAQNGHLDQAQALFQKAPQKNATTWNTMITAYSQHRDLEAAQSLFDTMPCKDSISWNAIITAYASNGHGVGALLLFRLMDLEGFTPTELTFIVVVEACATYRRKRDGQVIHSCIRSYDELLEHKVMVATALLNMHAKLGDVETAKFVFDGMAEKNDVSWNAMLAAYAQNGYLREALRVFERIPCRDVVSWNTIIGAYASHGLKSEALAAFTEMESEFGIAPNAVTFVILLLGSIHFDLAEVKSVHSRIASSKLLKDVKVATALVESYARCGSLLNSRKVFEAVCSRDTVIWNVMLAASSSLGASEQALYLFRCMNVDGQMPNDFTFTVILSVCSHAGLLEESLNFFSFMVWGCGIKASEEHYRCLSDLLGRVGRLSEAQDLFKELPDNIAWTSLVTACKVHGNI